MQLTTDGHHPYLTAVPGDFGTDFAMLVEHYDAESVIDQRRYSPARLIDSEKRAIAGNPGHEGSSTSYVERAYLPMRMGCAVSCV